MTRAFKPRLPQLLVQLVWLVRLRWAVAATVLAVGAANALWLHWFPPLFAIPALGAAILAYNAVLALLLRRRKLAPATRQPMGLAWGQMLADLAALTALVLWTGGLRSPILGLYVLHMVFASMLLPGRMPYAAAAAAAAMLAIGLAAAGDFPHDRLGYLGALGWLLSLALTVYLASRITWSLRRQRRRLVLQNRQIRAMTRRLRHQQQAMIQQEKLAAMGQMAAGVAHEIANPLASMDSLLQLMQRQPDKPRPQSVSTLRQQLQRVHAIVRQLTSFAHPGHADPEDVSVNHVVERALDLIRYDPRFRRVRLEKHLTAGPCSFRGQPRAVQQVLLNLIVNALDAMEQTPAPILTLASWREDPWCCVSVADNGSGVRPEHMGRLFEPFFTTKAVGKGTGLGLSVSHGLVQQHGGRIEVESQPGHGATFTVRLATAQTPANLPS